MTNAQAMADYESGYLRGQHDAEKRIVRRCTDEVDGKYFTMGYRQAFRDANQKASLDYADTDFALKDLLKDPFENTPTYKLPPNWSDQDLGSVLQTIQSKDTGVPISVPASMTRLNIGSQPWTYGPDPCVFYGGDYVQCGRGRDRRALDDPQWLAEYIKNTHLVIRLVVQDRRGYELSSVTQCYRGEQEGPSGWMTIFKDGQHTIDTRPPSPLQ